VGIPPGDEPPTKAMTTRQGPGTGVLGQATTRNPLMEAGQGSDDDDNLVLSHKRSGKERGNLRSTATVIQGKPASRISSPASSAPGSHAPAPVARSSAPSKASETESDSSPRPNKRARAKGQDRDGDDSDDGAKRGELRWRGTKQPVKRGGRRF
jgi:hypothetical protein